MDTVNLSSLLLSEESRIRTELQADSAIDQILRKQYPEKIAEYTGQLLLVAINYDKKVKIHQCRIERVEC